MAALRRANGHTQSQSPNPCTGRRVALSKTPAHLTGRPPGRRGVSRRPFRAAQVVPGEWLVLQLVLLRPVPAADYGRCWCFLNDQTCGTLSHAPSYRGGGELACRLSMVRRRTARGEGIGAEDEAEEAVTRWRRGQGQFAFVSNGDIAKALFLRRQH